MAEHGAVDHAAFAELYGGQHTTHGPRASCVVGDAVAIRPGFDGFNVLLRAYQLVGVQLFQSHVVPCLFVSILGKLNQSNRA